MSRTKTKRPPLLTVRGLPTFLRKLRLTGLTGEEEISLPFEYRLDLEGKLASLDESKLGELLERPLTTELGLDGGTRAFAGRVAVVGYEQNAAEESVRLTVVLRPRLWWLRFEVRTRLFTDRSARQIAAAVFADHGVDARWVLAREPKPRPFCLQYDESDLAFVGRLLEDEGIAFWFEHRAGGERLVLTDSPAGFADCPRGGPIPLQLPPQREAVPENPPAALTALRHVWQVTPKSHAQGDRRFDDPETLLAGTGPSTTAGRSGTVRDHGPPLADRAEARARAELRARASDSDSCLISGHGQARELAAGQWATLGDSPRRSLIRRVRHDVYQGKTTRYQNFFEAQPENVPFAPPRLHPVPVVAGGLPAVVVSTPDEHGRLRIRLECDASGTESSPVPHCHPAGLWFNPRPGQRVRVEFLGGRPDRPVISECLDHAITLAFEPAAHPRRGGLSDGRHFICLDDADDLRRLLLSVDGALQQLIRGDLNTVVDADETSQAKGSRHHTTEGDCTTRVGKAYSLSADGPIHLRSGQSIVIEGPGGKVVIDSSGILINGKPLLRFNPKSGAGATAAPPVPKTPRIADARKKANQGKRV